MNVYIVYILYIPFYLFSTSLLCCMSECAYYSAKKKKICGNKNEILFMKESHLMKQIYQWMKMYYY